MDDLISRQAAIEAIEKNACNTQRSIDAINGLPSVQPVATDTNVGNNSEIPNSSDCISRQAAIRWVKTECNPYGKPTIEFESGKRVVKHLEQMPSAQPEKETPKRVLWSGWKGMRDTRYKCPNCKKPVRNTDTYCHRCGQKLMFPNISFTPYVEGQKQELIVRWDDE